MPPLYRFGTGDAIDRYGNRSGQLDVVVENPFLPSLPLPTSESSRMYLAEGVSAAIEVKSDLGKQWSEVESTSTQLRKLRRYVGPFRKKMFGGQYSQSSSLIRIEGMEIIDAPSGVSVGPQGVSVGGFEMAEDSVPLIAVGYRGWKTMPPLLERIKAGTVDAILVLEHKLFASSPRFRNLSAKDDLALWGLICSLHASTVFLSQISTTPFDYVLPEQPSTGA
jgi:hypothetical protein